MCCFNVGLVLKSKLHDKGLFLTSNGCFWGQSIDFRGSYVIWGSPLGFSRACHHVLPRLQIFLCRCGCRGLHPACVCGRSFLGFAPPCPQDTHLPGARRQGNRLQGWRPLRVRVCVCVLHVLAPRKHPSAHADANNQIYAHRLTTPTKHAKMP